ncbi:MAG: DUF5916 domain-containing protein [Vicinamibacterales bacterium]
MITRVCILAALAWAVVCVPTVAAQDATSPRTTVAAANATPLTLPPGFAGATPPDLPATMSRDGEGRTTVRVVKLTAPLRVDGNLDEDIYRTVTPISDLIQVEPIAGAPATEKTEVWLSFDADNIYVSLRASESQPERMVMNEMRRDSFNVFQNENFQFAFDTFYDHRNSVSFQFNPIGGRMDGQLSNESTFNADWNPIWRLQVRRVADGWTAEAAVPFKSLRYTPGTAQVWGVQFRRINRWKNEISYLTQLPSNSGNNGHQRVSLYATMVGLEVPSGGTRALDLKPYITSDVTTDLTARPSAVRNRIGKDVGLDAKYALTQNMTADLTVNTDFAQVEADEQQVNLTRFSLFFPEKREFFLENQGLFQFSSNQQNDNSTTPTLFYSRRIGLEGGRQVPIDAGGRVSGRVGRYSMGVLNIQSSDLDAFSLPSNNFTVARLKRDVMRRSAVGALYTRRSKAAGGGGDSETYGIDASFNFYQNISFNAYWAKTSNPGRTRDDQSYRGQAQWNADRWGVQVERVRVGNDFDPQVGFMRRTDFTKDRAFFRFSPRPRQRFRGVRKFSYQGAVNYFRDGSGQLETREQNLEFSIEWQTSDKLTVSLDNNYEHLDAPFGIASGVTIPSGGYGLRTYTAEFQVGQQRLASGTWWVETGPFYDGDRTAFGYRGARVKVNQHLALEPGLSINHVTLPFGDFTAKLISTRATYTVTPLMFVSSLVQYNSSNNSLSTNVRFRWEYQPGSEVFIVYNDGRDTAGDRFAGLQNRAVVVKINRLFRF